MKLKNLSKEELDSMSYDDVAYMILKINSKKMKIMDLLKEVIEAKGLDMSKAEDYIGEFFTLLSTEKRFIQLEKGFWDLRENHTSKIELSSLEDEEDTEDITEEDEEDLDSDINENMYIDENKEIDDDEVEDEYKDLVVIDDESDMEL